MRGTTEWFACLNLGSILKDETIFQFISNACDNLCVLFQDFAIRILFIPPRGITLASFYFFLKRLCILTTFIWEGNLVDDDYRAKKSVFACSRYNSGLISLTGLRP